HKSCEIDPVKLKESENLETNRLWRPLPKGQVRASAYEGLAFVTPPPPLVIQPERALYIQANNCVEARDWIDILTKVSQSNRKRLSTYHPSAYLNGHWLCCKLSADTAPG
ncbi:hypothetical protein XENOCAPTIV_027440, partial [Xenoophorus captivus]